MRKTNDQSLKEVLQAFLNTNDKVKNKLFLAKIKDFWQSRMGPSITRYTTEIELKKHKLYLVIASAPLRQELSMSKEKIKDMINEMLGENFVEEVFIR
jgi:predicted nucleic acid-binding Zn ribbon protein